MVELTEENFNYRFEVIFLSSWNAEEFLVSEIPQELTLSILCDFGAQSVDEMLQLIKLRLLYFQSRGIPVLKFIQQLRMLSQLRNLEDEVLKITSDMLAFDVKRDPLYKQGVQSTKQKAVIKMLKSGLDLTAISEFLDISNQEIMEIKEGFFKKKPIKKVKNGALASSN